jgi:hypothetical protein
VHAKTAMMSWIVDKQKKDEGDINHSMMIDVVFQMYMMRIIYPCIQNYPIA